MNVLVTNKNTLHIKKPYITYYQANIASEASSSEEGSRDVTPIKTNAIGTNKFEGSCVTEIDEMYDHVDIKNGNKEVDIEKFADNRSITFAIDGTSFDVVKKHFPDDADKLRVQGTVFARMSPDQKEYLIGKQILVI